MSLVCKRLITKKDMNQKQLEIMLNGKGFIAALDQSGGSTPKALADYGVAEDSYVGEERMFELVHEMRSRIMTSSEFTSERVLGAILFEKTMDSMIEGRYTADYLWEVKGVVPFLKVDKGLADFANGVQLMKPMPELGSLLDRAVDRNIFGTKMRSVIKELDETGIEAIAKQQFEVAREISAKGLVPIIEPEVDIHAVEKEAIENVLLKYLVQELAQLPEETKVIFKLSLPNVANLYAPLMEDSRTVRVVALSGGYEREVANAKLADNTGMIASFSRALIQDLRAQQSDEEFDTKLGAAIQSIYEASIR